MAVVFAAGGAVEYPTGSESETFALTLPVEVGVGDWLIFNVTSAARDLTITPPVGAGTILAMVSPADGGNLSGGVYAWRVPAPKPATVSFVWPSPQRGSLAWVAVSGASGVDASSDSGWLVSGSTSKAAPGITVTDGAFVLAVVMQDAGSATITPPVGWLARTDATQRDGHLATLGAVSGTTDAASFTVSDLQEHRLLQVALTDHPGSIDSMAWDGRTVTVTGSGTTGTLGWDWGDGTTGSGSPASHTYSADGLYPVRLTDDGAPVDTVTGWAVGTSPRDLSPTPRAELRASDLDLPPLGDLALLELFGDAPAGIMVTGTTTATSTTTGTVNLAPAASGTIPAVSTVTGSPAAILAATGTNPTTSAAVGAPGAVLAVTGSIAATSIATGSPGTISPTTGTASASSTTAGTVAARLALAAASVAISATAGQTAARLAATGVVVAISTTSGDPAIAGDLSITGTVAAASTTSGAVGLLTAAQGTVTAASTASGQVTARLAAASTVVVISAVSGEVLARYALTGRADAQGTTAGWPAGILAAAGTTPAAGAATGEPRLLGAATGSSEAHSISHGDLTAILAIAGDTAAVSTTSGTVTVTSTAGWRDLTIRISPPIRATITATDPGPRLVATEPARTLLSAVEPQPRLTATEPVRSHITATERTPA